MNGARGVGEVGYCFRSVEEGYGGFRVLGWLAGMRGLGFGEVSVE